MTHAELQDLLGAYALDAVDGDERDELERHLAECARCRAELADHREVAALLANTGADAPPALWERIAGNLDAAPPPLQLAPRRRRPSWPLQLAAAAAVLVIAALGLEVRNQSDRIDKLQAAATTEVTGRPFRLAGASIEVDGAIRPDGTAYLIGASLPRLDPGRTYQLWGKVGDRLVSLAVLGNDPRVVTFRAGPSTLLAITEEVAGGVVQSANQPVVSGSLA